MTTIISNKHFGMINIGLRGALEGYKCRHDGERLKNCCPQPA
jgi:hypothetical protein